MELLEIRKVVESLPRMRDGRIWKIPELVRLEVIARLKSYEGASLDFAKQVGLSHATIARWRSNASPKNRMVKHAPFRRLEIKSEGASGVFCVEGPMGLRVSALSLAQVADLFKAVSR